MGLRDIAEADLKAIVENTADFGWPVTVTKPGGPTVAMVGLSTDISQTIDPDTGQAVSGRNASVSFVMSSLLTAFSALPTGISDGAPWVVVFADIAGASHTFKVLEALPDRALGCVVCLLEHYIPSP